MSISVAIVRGILTEVRSRGFDPDELLRRSGFDSARLADLREQVQVAEGDLLIRNAIALTGDPGLGLSIGANAPEAMLQVLGHLILAHRTIREACAAVSRYVPLIVDGLNFSLIEQGELALFTCTPVLQLGDATRCLVDGALAVAARIGLHFDPPGQKGNLREVRLTHAEPSYAERYVRVFKCPVRFEQPMNALVFPRHLVDTPQPHADDTTRALLREAAERLLQERAPPQSIAERVSALLRYEQDLANVDVERIARQLGLSPRTLRRRLGSEGMPFSSLIDAARCRVACQELRRPDASIKETAELLGFSEPSAFHRAFKRWTGCTPAEYARHTSENPQPAIPGKPFAPAVQLPRSQASS